MTTPTLAILRSWGLAVMMLMAAAPARAQCPLGCSGHGACIGSNCFCDSGYTGPGCQYSGAVTCNGHGTANFDGSCTCQPNYAGPSCSLCAPGYYGPFCQPCPGGAATPCGGHGICTDGMFGSGNCFCDFGYAGPACQYSNFFTCSNHGTANFDGSCSCATGFGGTNCAQCALGYINYPTCSRCKADFNFSGAVTIQDLFDFLKAWFGFCLGSAGPPCNGASADMNSTGTITVQDLFDFLALWFAKC